MKKTTFVNVSLSAMQRVRWEEFAIHLDDWPYLLHEAALMGLKVSFKYDVEREGWGVYITDLLKGSVNEGCTLSCWGGSLENAVQDVSIYFNFGRDQGVAWSKVKDAFLKEEREDIENYREYLIQKGSLKKDNGG